MSLMSDWLRMAWKTELKGISDISVLFASSVFKTSESIEPESSNAKNIFA